MAALYRFWAAIPRSPLIDPDRQFDFGPLAAHPCPCRRRQGSSPFRRFLPAVVVGHRLKRVFQAFRARAGATSSADLSGFSRTRIGDRFETSADGALYWTPHPFCSSFLLQLSFPLLKYKFTSGRIRGLPVQILTDRIAKVFSALSYNHGSKNRFFMRLR